jgi:peptidylprolyl isomerase
MRRIAALCATVLLLGGLAACGGSDSGIDGLTVTGDFGKEPKVKVDSLDESSPKTHVLIEGSGEKLTSSSAAMVHLLLAKGTDGSTLQSTYSQGDPQKVELAKAPSWIQGALNGVRVGSRVLYVTPLSKLNNGQGDEQHGLKATDDIVIVIDVMDTATPTLDGPQGKKVEPPKDAPTIVEEGGTITGLDFSNAPKEDPTKFQVIPLVEGTGEAIKEGDQITANYIGTKWGSSKPFDNSFTRGQPAPYTVASGVTASGQPGVIKGWVKGLVGVKVGSRVMLIVPPELGYGKQGNPQIKIGPHDTMAFLIDVLSVN